MAVELSYLKGSVAEAAKELELDPSRLSVWRMDPRFNGGAILPKNDRVSPEEQEVRGLKKRLKDSELENAILKKAVAIFFSQVLIFNGVQECLAIPREAEKIHVHKRTYGYISSWEDVQYN